jgi:hypothetical protein
MPDTVRLTFRYHVGQRVRYEGQVWTITRRWYCESAWETWIMYSITPGADGVRVFEADLTAAGEG